MIIGNFNKAKAQNFPAQNVSLLGRWFDSTVVSEPQHGIKYNGVFGWTNPGDGREYAIIGSTAGTYFIEVTNPSLPVVRDFVGGRRDSCVWREIHTYQNFCYMVSDDGLPNSFQIVDLSPLPDSVHVVHDSTNIMSRCHTIFVDGDKLYAGIPKGPFGQSSMAVFSLKNNPASPFLLRRLEEDYTGIDATHDMFVRHDTIYASMSNSGYFVYRFDTLLNKFLLLGSLTSYPFKGYNHSSSVTESGISIMCDEVPSGLQVKAVDVNDLSDITVTDTFKSNTGATPHNPYVVGNNRVVIAYYQDGVQIFDISDPSNITRSGYFDTRPEIGDNNGYPGDPYQGCWGAFTGLPSGNLLASDMQNGLFILNINAALGMDENIQTKSFSFIYPNPNTGKFSILWKKEREISSLKIISVLGSIVFSKSMIENNCDLSGDSISGNFQYSVDVSDFPEGIYFVLLSGMNFTEVKKLVKTNG